MEKKKSSIFKTFAKICLGFLVFLVISGLIFLLPPVQNSLQQEITRILSKNTGAQISIGKVKVSPFKKMFLEDIILRDQTADTLFYADKLTMRLSIFSLLRKKIKIKSLNVDNSNIKLYRISSNNEMNTSFLEDNRSSVKPDESPISGWKMDIDQIEFRDLAFSYIDPEGTEVKSLMPKLFIALNQIDIEGQHVNIKQIDFSDAKIEIFSKEKKIDKSQPDLPLEFPFLDWMIQVKRAHLMRNNIYITLQNGAENPGKVGSGHHALTDLNMGLNDLVWHEKMIMGKVMEASLKYNETFHLKRGSMEMAVTPQSANFKDLELETNHSKIVNSTTLDYQEFNDLSRFMDKVDARVEFQNSTISEKDLQFISNNFSAKLPLVASSTVTIDGILHKENRHLFGEQLHLVLDTHSELNFQGGFSIDTIDQIQFENLEVIKLKSTSHVLKSLVPKNLFPVRLDDIGNFEFKGILNGNMDHLRAENIWFRSNDLKIEHTNAEILHLPDKETRTFHVETSGIGIEPTLIKNFIADSLHHILAELGRIEIAGNIHGRDDDFSLIGDVRARTLQMKLELELSSKERNKPRYSFDNISFDADFKRLVLDPRLSRLFLPDSLKYYIDSLGIVEFSGALKGDVDQIFVEGEISSKHGNVGINSTIDFDEMREAVKYSSEFILADYNFHSFTNGMVENACGKIWLAGTDANHGDHRINWKAEIENLIANDYQYDSIEIEGYFKDHNLVGNGVIRDEHMNGLFEIDASLEKEQASLKLNLQAHNFNLHQANLYPKPVAITGNFNFDLQGKSWKDVIGRISSDQWSMSNDSLHIKGGDISIISEKIDDQNNRLSLNSKHLNIDIEGKYNLKSLPYDINFFLNEYFKMPIMQKATSDLALPSPFEDFDFNMKVTGKDLSDISQILFPKINSLDQIEIRSEFNSKQNHLAINGSLSNFAYQDWQMDSLSLHSFVNSGILHNQLTVTQFSTGQLVIPQIEISSDFADQLLNFSTKLQNPQSNDKIIFAGSVSHKDDAYKIQFAKDFTINTENWTINPENEIRFTKSNWTIEDFKMSFQDQSLGIFTTHQQKYEENPPIILTIEQFDFKPFSRWIDQSKIEPEGIINGNITFFDLTSQPYFLGHITIDDLMLQGYLIGEAKLEIQNSANQDMLNISGQLNGTAHQVDLNGNYIKSQEEIDAAMNIRDFDLKTLDFLFSEEFEIMSGKMDGLLDIKGQIPKLVLNGKLNTHQLKTRVIRTNSAFSMPSCSVIFKDDEIHLDTCQILDVEERISLLSGKISHQFFKDLILDMHFESQEFQALNSTKSDHDFFYGTLLTKAEIDVNGPPSKLVVKVNAKTAVGTDLTLLNNSQLSNIQQDNFIVFVDPKDKEQTKTIQTMLQLANPYKYELNANIEITPEAILRIILDDNSEDALLCQGTANLKAHLDSEGNLDLTGNYTFKEGKYRFNYEGLVKKEFEIENGSSIIFPSSSNDYQFDITTRYRTKANTLPLIYNQSTLSDSERKAANKLVEIIVLLNIRGSRNEPQMNFQLLLPDEDSGQLGNAINRRLTQLNANPDEMNRQVLGLLLFNSFISEGHFASSSALSQSVETAAFSNLRGMITNQLNKLANQYIKGFEVNFDMDAYHSGNFESSSGLITEMGVSVSKKIFNERLKVSVGSNVNLARENAVSWSNTTFSSVAGDFVIEYKLNNKGNYLVRVFHLNDYNIIEDENNYKTGVGFVIRKQLEGNKKKKKKKGEQ